MVCGLHDVAAREADREAVHCVGIWHLLPLYVTPDTWKNRVTVNVHLSLFPGCIWALLPPGGVTSHC